MSFMFYVFSIKKKGDNQIRSNMLIAQINFVLIFCKIYLNFNAQDACTVSWS